MTITENNSTQAPYHVMLKCIEPLIGSEDLTAVLDTTHQLRPGSENVKRVHGDLMDIPGLLSAMEEYYGPLTGQGIALRSGRNCFESLYRESDLHSALSEMTRMMLPVTKRMVKGLEILGDQISRQFNVDVLTSTDDLNWYWKVSEWPGGSEGSESNTACQFFIGLILEFTSWMSGGRDFEVKEIPNPMEAAANGFTIQIKQKPMD